MRSELDKDLGASLVPILRKLIAEVEALTHSPEWAIAAWQSLPWYKRLWYWITDGPKEGE